MKKIVMFRIRSMQMGGVPKVLIDIIKNLDKEKFEPFILMDTYQGELLKDIPQNILVIPLAKGREEMSQFRLLFFFQLVIRNFKLRLYRYFPSLIKKKLKVIPDTEVAITHSSLSDLVKSPFKNSKKVNWFHTDIRWHHSIKYGNKIADMMRLCDITIFGSLHTKMSFENHLNVKIPRSIYIHNAFDGKEVQKKALEKTDDITKLFTGKKTFVSVGRLVHQKGYDMLIESHDELLREGFEHQIIVIGGGSDDDVLKSMIVQYGIENSFLLLGNKNNPYPYIKAADFYIQPSRYESYPVVLGEVLILNKPIICTNVGGVEELLIHRETAHLVDFDKNKIKEAMKDFLYNPTLVEKIIQRQKHFDYKDYNQDIYVKINNLFSKL